jgi:hypothetical protein
VALISNGDASRSPWKDVLNPHIALTESVRWMDQLMRIAMKRARGGEKETSVRLHCLLFHVSSHAIELCFPRLVCVSIARNHGHHCELTDMRYRMWPCLMVSNQRHGSNWT